MSVSKRTELARKRDERTQRLVEAIREVLGLDPLYEETRKREREAR